MADLKIFSAGVAMRLAKQAIETFEAEHPELDVEFSGGGSVAGVNRLLGGEDLDVLILADQTAIDEQLMPDFADGYFVWGGQRDVHHRQRDQQRELERSPAGPRV